MDATFSEIAKMLDAKFPFRPQTFGDGIRSVPFAEVPFDAPARSEGATVYVRVPRPWQKRPEQGWLSGSWSL